MKKLQLILENENKTKKEKIEFGLYDTSSALKVYTLLEDTKRGSKMFPRIDVRQKKTVETTQALAEEMNWVIDEVNRLGEDCTIDEALKLDLEVAPHEQVKKLNALHEIFQLYTEHYGTDFNIVNGKFCSNETQTHLERVNILVHMLEAGPVEIDQVFMVAKQEAKYSEQLDDVYDTRLSDEDHMQRFPNALWGVLEMDYHTVGKDLGACYHTDDIELVASGELRQQQHFSPCVAANFMTSAEYGTPTEESDKRQQQTFYDWCASNNIDEYVDYTLPVYRIGRMRLGEITETYNIEDIQTLVIEYPSIKEIILINDK